MLPEGVDLCISTTGERHGFGASAPWLTRASSLIVFRESWRFGIFLITEVGQTHRVVMDPVR